jgi:hypothetical protein
MAALARSPRRGRIVLAFFVAALVFGALQLPPLGEMSDHGVGIIELELMRTSAKAEQYYRQLGADGREAARTSLDLDYPYLIFYGFFLATACVVVAARGAERGMRRLARLGIVLAFGALIGAFCDAVENAALLRVLAGHTDQPWPGIAFGFAVGKFALTIAAALFALVGYLLTRSRTAPTRPEGP